MKKQLTFVGLILLILTSLAEVVCMKFECSMTNPCANQLAQGRDFAEPAQLRSTSTSWTVNLTVDIGDITYDWLTLKRRLYNGGPCGPTVNVKRKDVLTLNLINNLSPEGNVLGKGINTQKHPNSTNIHTHGLHISSRTPQDNVLIHVHPKSHFQYRYHIDAHNAPGTNWYHAHLHGSTAFQVIGGLGGMLIVEDNVNEMAAELSAASCPNNCDKDIQLVFQPLLIFGGYTGYGRMQERISEYHTFRNDRFKVAGGGTLTQWLEDNVNYFTTNGQLHPKLQMRTGQMYRFRMLNAGGVTNLEVYISDFHGRPTSKCDIREIALDGIYLPAPRRMHDRQSLLVPAGRVDWLVKCKVPGIYKVTSFHSDKNNPSLGTVDHFNGDLVTLEVAGKDAKSTFPKILPGQGITHLRDLRDVAEEDIKGRYVVEFDPYYYLNRELWSGSQNCRYKMRLGEIQEWQILSADSFLSHPFHMHVNHFQVISYNNYTGAVGMDEGDSWCLTDVNDVGKKCHYQRKGYNLDEKSQSQQKNISLSLQHSLLKYLGHDKRFAEDAGGTLGYSRLGDWRDTLSVPPLANITIRFIPTDFVGDVILHCHSLEHEDHGMMMLVGVVPPGESTAANIQSGDAYPGTCRKCDRYPPNNATDLCGTA